MRLLIDTHALLWWILDDPALSPSARKHLGNPGNGILVSSASAWEIATKFRIGKLPDGAVELVSDSRDTSPSSILRFFLSLLIMRFEPGSCRDRTRTHLTAC